VIAMTRLVRLRTPGALLALSALAVSACTSGAGPAASATSAASAPPSQAAVAGVPSIAASPVATPAASAEPSPSAESSGTALGSGPTAVPTSIDPCQLIPKEEAGQLAGTTFGAGKEEETSGHAKMCTYGAGTSNVFEVVVAIAPDEATAKAQEQAAMNDLKKTASDLPGGLHVTELPNFAPGADAVEMDGSVSVAGQSISGRGFYVLRGTDFFGFNDLVRNAPAPSEDAAKAEAMTVLGRLP
jgi:hypothetical protein